MSVHAPIVSTHQDVEVKLHNLGMHNKFSLDMFGYLKVVSSTHLRSEPKRKLFRLKNNLLYMYESAESTKPLEIIAIEVCRAGRPEKNQFEVVSPYKSYIFFAEDTEMRKEWVTALKRASMLRVEDYYQIRETLGAGTFSKVKLGIHKKTGCKYAVKIIDKACFQKNKDSLMTEIAILQTVDHPHIVKLCDIFETNSSIYLIFDLLTGGELFDRIVEKGAYSERDTSMVIFKITSAIQYLHKRNIVHRDLKPENLLYSSDQEDADIKISDFGLSKFVQKDDLLRTPCGTPGYVAPEVLMLKGYDKAVDMWSIGVIMYILLCGFPPFHADSDAELFEEIKYAEVIFPSPYWDHISSEGRDLLTHLLDKNPLTRYTADQALEHPWIMGTSVSTEVMPSVLAAIRRYNARRKFRANMGTASSQAQERRRYAQSRAPSTRGSQGFVRPRNSIRRPSV